VCLVHIQATIYRNTVKISIVSTILKIASKPSTTEKSSLYIVGILPCTTISPELSGSHMSLQLKNAQGLKMPYTCSVGRLSQAVLLPRSTRNLSCHLDEMDDLAIKLGATNNVYLNPFPGNSWAPTPTGEASRAAFSRPVIGTSGRRNQSSSSLCIICGAGLPTDLCD